MISNKKPHIVVGIFGSTVLKWEKHISLKDGGAAVFVNGELKIAISEERLNRIKHSTGYENAVKYCLDELNIKEKDIDFISLSNCCDTPYYLNGSLSGLLSRNYNKIRIVNSHHESHAILAALQSGFSECLIMVADNEGNLLGNINDSLNYWNNPFERVSYYIFQNGNLKLLERDCTEYSNIGLGDTFHYFTHYLGWHSYTQAGKVMGLSAYGDRNAFKKFPLFTLDNHNRIISKLTNDRSNKYESVKKYGKTFDHNFPDPRKEEEPLTKGHMNIAAWIQDELERIVTKRIEILSKKTNITNICLSGGIAYNCLSNRKVFDLPVINKVFVPYAPGDEGQPLGNAVIELLKTHKYDEVSIGTSPFLGRIYSEEEITSSIKKSGIIKWKKVKNIEKITAELIAAKKIIGWVQGRSEMGSRALGNRSVLADPRFNDMKDYVNKLKGREWFRPFAPSILKEFQSEFFDLNIDVPYMNIAANVLSTKKDIIPAVTHEDNTSRIQTVSKSINPKFYALIFEFYKITGIPLLINTSFNMNGEPIVENPDDAIKTFLKMKLDYLVIEDFILQKS